MRETESKHKTRAYVCMTKGSDITTMRIAISHAWHYTVLLQIDTVLYHGP